MPSNRFRQIALGLPGVIEGSHQGHADFSCWQAHLRDPRLSGQGPGHGQADPGAAIRAG